MADSTPYLQIDLGSPHVICAIATQGDHLTDKWTEAYRIQASTDGSTFTSYLEAGVEKVRLLWLLTNDLVLFPLNMVNNV